MAESGMLLQYVVRGPTTWGLRILADGQVEELSNEEPERAERGGGASAPLAWRALTRLAPDGLDRLRAVLRRADFAALPQHTPPEAGPDTVVTTWDIDLN